MRVNAQATIKILRKPAPNVRQMQFPEVGFGSYDVTVVGEAPFDFIRIYPIFAPDENQAARQGLDRFVAEFDKEPN